MKKKDETVETQADQTAETAETTENESTGTNAETKPSFDPATLDEFGQLFVARTSADITKVNEKINERKSLSSDPAEIEEATHESLKNANMPEGMEEISAEITAELLAEYDAIVKREVELDMKFREVAKQYAEKKAAENTDTEKVAVLDTEIETLEKKIKEARRHLAVEFPGAETLLPELVKASGKSAGTGKGSGGRKLRGFTVSVDGEVKYLGKDANKKSSFAAAASALSIPTGELQAAYFTAAKTEDVEKVPAEVTFTVKGSDNNEHTVLAKKNPS